MVDYVKYILKSLESGSNASPQALFDLNSASLHFPFWAIPHSPTLGRHQAPSSSWNTASPPPLRALLLRVRGSSLAPYLIDFSKSQPQRLSAERLSPPILNFRITSHPFRTRRTPSITTTNSFSLNPCFETIRIFLQVPTLSKC